MTFKPHPKQVEFLNDNRRRVLWGGGQPTRAFVRGLRCLVGLHDFVDYGPRHRYCRRCPLWQRLDFYSNRTQAWVRSERPPTA